MRDKGGAHPEDGRHRALAALAERQHGIVSIRQLIGPLGYSKAAVHRAVKAGRLHQLYRGVFAVGHTNLSLHAQCLAAVLACAPNALLSHGSAAWLWGLTKTSPLPASVCASSHRTPRPPLRLHESRSLATADRTLREGIPVTSLPRTLLDLAATVRFEWLEKMVERSEDLELCLQAGLPQPRMNFVAHGFELDCYWPEFRFAVELDVFETHGSRAAFERDRKRQEDLLLLGIGMTRVTGPRLEREPREVIRRVALLLEQRRGASRLRA